MNVTKDKAAKQWCPMARATDGSTRCIHERCMMWRWFDDPSRDERKGYCGIAGRPSYVE